MSLSPAVVVRTAAWRQRSLQNAACLDVYYPVKGITCNLCALLNLDRFRRMQGPGHPAADDDMPAPHGAADASRLVHDNRAAGIGRACHVALDIALNAQHTRPCDASLYTQACTNQGVGAAR